MSAIFAAESTDNPVALIKQTLSVKPDDDGKIMVTFTTNRGKGSGAQVMPYTEFREAVSVLINAAKNGIPEIAEDDNLPASEVVRRTLTLDDFQAVVDLLSSTVDAVESAGKSLSKK